MRNRKHELVRVVALAAAAVAVVAGAAEEAWAQTVVEGRATASAQAGTQPQSSVPVRLSVTEAIDLAVKASHRVGEVEAREDVAKAVASLRETADKPNVTLLGGYQRTNHIDQFAIQIPGTPPRVIYPDIPDSWRSRLDVQWTVYTSGRMLALDRAAQAEVSAAGKDVATARADIRLDAARAFWTLVTATEAVKVVEGAVKAVDAHLHDVRSMLAAGLVAPSDVLRAETNQSRQQVLLIEARNARDVAEADLRRATGLGSAVPIELAAALEGAAPSIPAIDDLLGEARKMRPERQALELRINSIAQQRTAAAAENKPVVSLAGGFDYARPNPRIFPRAGKWNESWDVGVNIAWPIWDGGRTKSDVAQTSASERAARERLAEFDRILEFDVRQRQLDLTSAVASITAATAGVASATEARRVVSDRFKAGLASSTDVLDAHQALLGAQLDRTRTLAAVKLALARIDRVVGR